MRALHITSRMSVAFPTSGQHSRRCTTATSMVSGAVLIKFGIRTYRGNDYCGLIKECGVVVVAAHCMFCLGADAPLAVRFAQFSDDFQLHKNMKEHLKEGRTPTICPHRLCTNELSSEFNLWNHATTVQCIPPFGQRRVTGKRNPPKESDVDDVVWWRSSAK
jgi:hypothetical protein